MLQPCCINNSSSLKPLHVELQRPPEPDTHAFWLVYTGVYNRFHRCPWNFTCIDFFAGHATYERLMDRNQYYRLKWSIRHRLDIPYSSKHLLRLYLELFFGVCLHLLRGYLIIWSTRICLAFVGPLVVGIRVTLSTLSKRYRCHWVRVIGADHPQWGPWSIPRSIIPQGHCHQDQRQSEADIEKPQVRAVGQRGGRIGKLWTTQPSNNCDSLYHILSYCIISCHVMYISSDRSFDFMYKHVDILQPNWEMCPAHELIFF